LGSRARQEQAQNRDKIGAIKRVKTTTLSINYTLAGAGGLEPPHSGIEIRQDSSLGLRDSNLCILKLDLLNFIPPQGVLGIDRARL
jgi:hypothetical protein